MYRNVRDFSNQLHLRATSYTISDMNYHSRHNHHYKSSGEAHANILVARSCKSTRGQFLELLVFAPHSSSVECSYYYCGFSRYGFLTDRLTSNLQHPVFVQVSDSCCTNKYSPIPLAVHGNPYQAISQPTTRCALSSLAAVRKNIPSHECTTVYQRIRSSRAESEQGSM